MDTATLRVLDASLNRAAEGLRVVEDFTRFVLNDGHLSRLAKDLRHELAALGAALAPAGLLHAARDTRGDVGATVTLPSEQSRDSASEVCAASLKRVEQSLRSIEEFGKQIDQRCAAAAERLRYRAYTLEKAIGTASNSARTLDDKRLCVLLDGGASQEEFLQLVSGLVDAGVGVLQLRDKSLDDRRLLDRGRALVATTRGRRSLAIINDRCDIAAACGADGVHLGQDDLSVADARRIVGPAALIGVSTHNLPQARQAVLDGAGYLGAGPTFASRTKAFDAFAGLDYLRQVSTEVSLPTFAIGGIEAGNLEQVLAAGARRVAVASAVTAAADPAAAVRQLVQALAASAGPGATDPDAPPGSLVS